MMWGTPRRRTVAMIDSDIAERRAQLLHYTDVQEWQLAQAVREKIDELLDERQEATEGR